MKNLTFLVMLFAFGAWAEPEEKFDPQEDQISDKYEAGLHLIYDCKDGHWVCVRKEFYKECEESRAEGLAKKQVRFNCAPIGPMASKKACYQRVLYLTTHNHGHRFCINDEWKEKAYE